jgi:hypothetical protein
MQSETVSNSGSSLQGGGLDAQKSARALQSIRDNACRQARLFEELLDLSKLKRRLDDPRPATLGRPHR